VAPPKAEETLFAYRPQADTGWLLTLGPYEPDRRRRSPGGRASAATAAP
jgi:hypothetical protein